MDKNQEINIYLEADVTQTLRFLNEKPFFSVVDVQRYFRVTYMTASRWLEAWLRDGFIVALEDHKFCLKGWPKLSTTEDERGDMVV
jgi:hypothetical protein